jgi:flagellar hook-basal body complex protein FliE
MSTQGIEQMLRELRAVSGRAAGAESAAISTDGGFAEVLKSSLQQVSAAQEQAGELQQQFNLNSPDVNLQDVMVSLQKANISFQAMVQVRNKLVSAYQEIMNMQV